MEKIYYKSDFSIIEDKANEDYSLEFDFRYFVKGGVHVYEVSHKNGEFHNCYLNEQGKIEVVFHDHFLGIGEMTCNKLFYLPDVTYPGGVRLIEKVDDSYNVKLVRVLTSVQGSFNAQKITLETHGGKAEIKDGKIIMKGLGVTLSDETIKLN